MLCVVCLSVCLSVCVCLKYHLNPQSTKFSVRPAGEGFFGTNFLVNFGVLITNLADYRSREGSFSRKTANNNNYNYNNNNNYRIQVFRPAMASINRSIV